MKLKLRRKDDGGEAGDPQPPSKKPTSVSNPNDPRLGRYKDSMALYNYGQEFHNRLNSLVHSETDDNYSANRDFMKWVGTDPASAPYRRLAEYNNENPGKRIPGTTTVLELDNTRTHNAIVWEYGYSKPVQPYTYNKPVPPPPQRTQVQGVQPTPYVPNVQGSAMAPQAPIDPKSNFSFTGRDSNGQQTTRYFSDLDTWKQATDQMDYRQRNVTNNGQEAHATGYQFKDGGMKLKKADTGGGYSPVGTPLAQVVQPPNTMKALPGMMPNAPNIMPGQPTNDPNNPDGPGINWDHVFATQVATNLAQGAVSRFSPNSQQNTTQQFNRQQFSPMNFLPYTPNNSLQAQYGTQGMRRGGAFMEDGGIVDSEAMRKWILGDDTPATEEQEETPQLQQQEDTSQRDAQQFAMFAQMFGLDQADGEKEPEQQDQGYMQKKGGWIKHAVNPAHKGYCTPMTKSTCTGHRRAFAETMKKHHGFHEDGGIVYRQGGEYDLSSEQIAYMKTQGYEFE